MRSTFQIFSARSVRNTKWNADAHLRAHEKTVKIEEEAILRVDSCQLAANSPIEDYYSGAKCLSSNAFLFGVFDGHGGPYCSRHVCTNLFPYVCAAVLKKHEKTEIALDQRLQWLFSSSDSHLPNDFVGEASNENFVRFYEEFKEHAKSGTVREALKAAFESCDHDLARAALPSGAGFIDKHAALIAASGSCATLAHIRSWNLHVANIGDAAAVLGVVTPNGDVIARRLSRPHSQDTANEVERIRKAHPASESSTIFRQGRLLGELIPLRAFGDVRYKWPLELQKVVLEPLGFLPPLYLHTPPYLTASPEVFYHKLTPNDKFLVLATDGLWDFLDPDTVVRLVHDHTLGTQTLQPYTPRSGVTLGQVLRDLNERHIGEKKSKKPIDENSATHIIRNALGGVSGGINKQYEKLIDTLKVPPGRARGERDDISVVVIHFDTDYVGQHADDED
ncbi:hypothetical protein WR25_16791 [Diploscapter pachys]|uniref:PPM-type phosphatase domain-containing protein n=1 Tax=Diploscapter pachys TaxID=2018661 RepID=A0A2A2L263_9BILA|nr:hypothetical protein WR25_16791 [Diploscapter pachys]